MAGLMLAVSACGSGGSKVVAAPRVTTTTAAPVTTTTVPAPPPGSSYVASPVTSPVTYSATAGGPPVDALPTVTWGGPTYRPVISMTDAWVQVGLDTKPNHSTGWVARSAVDLALTDSRIEISVSMRSLTLYQKGVATYTSPVGVGTAQYPTPLGRTFIDAIVATPQIQLNVYGPVVLILGLHSDVRELANFDGGTGTVAIHGYPSNPASTRGVASSHGCIRASPETINAIDKVPLGSPVDVVA
jgi:hypothetical protein